MSTTTENQEKAFRFLKEKFHSQEAFTGDEFRAAIGFSKASFDTYRSKQFRGLLLPTPDGKYRVSGAFRKFKTWKLFKENVVSQNRNFSRPYAELCHDDVIVFEFYMPLRNEEYLRETLDALFFKDAVQLRLRAIDQAQLVARIPRKSDETVEQHLNRTCALISEKFVGYSINHVSGRFRADSLKSRAEVFGVPGPDPQRYIVDETTAVVRFIIPCDEAQRSKPAGKGLMSALKQDVIERDAEVIRWLFEQVFVKSVLELVNAEDEIWLLESGMRSRLHIWRAID